MPMRPVASMLIGAASAMVGLLPWLITGLRSPLQNIWDEQTLPDDMPLVLLPLTQYHLVNAVAMMVIGAAIAGTVVRLAGRPSRRAGQRTDAPRRDGTRRGPLLAWLVWCGVAAVQVVALVQTATVLGGGLEDSGRARVYLLGMVAGVAVGIAVGLAVYVGLVRGSIAGATLAITFAALALAQWSPVLVSPYGSTWVHHAPPLLIGLMYSTALWLPVLIVGVALGWCGTSSVRRSVASSTSLVALWVVPALVTGFTYAVGSRVYLQNPAELLPAGTQVFQSALLSIGAVQRMVVALAVAVVVAGALRSLRLRRETARAVTSGADDLRDPAQGRP